LAQAIGPAPQGAVSEAQKTTAVNSTNQSQSNVTVNVVLSTISSVIQTGLANRQAIGRQRAALASIAAREVCEPVACDSAAPIEWSAWVSGGGGQSTNSLTVGGYNLGNYGTQAGLQAQITPKLLLGIGGSWQGTTGFLNGGFTSTSSVWGITPYLGWQFHENWNLSAMAGFSTGTSWLNGGVVPPYASAYQSTQWTFQGGLNGMYMAGNVFLAPTVSLTVVPMTTFGYTDSVGSFIPSSSTSLTRGSIGGMVGISLENGLQPYIRASLEHDFAMPAGSQANGSTGGTVGVGMSIPVTEKVSASIDGGYNSIGRVGLALWAASARLSYRF
jgi:hypothetical protein